MRGWHQQGDQGRADTDIDREIAIEAALDHLRNHRAADRGHVRNRRTGHAAEEQIRQHIDLAEAAADMTDQAGGKTDQAFGNAAAQHQLTGKDEQRNRDQRDRTGAGRELLGGENQRQVEMQYHQHRGRGQRVRNRHTREQQQAEGQKQQGDGHQWVSSGARSRCGSENRAISAPPRLSGK